MFTDSFVDVSVPGRGLGFGLVRSYSSSRATVEGWFGNGWSSNLETRLILADGTGATFVDGTGARDYFVLQPDATTYRAASNVYGVLVKETTGGVVTYRLTDWRARMAWTFDNGGRLLSITDRNVESIALAWGAATVTVTLPKENAGRSMVLTFNGDPTTAGSNVTQVVDPMGRTNTYGYTSNNLTSATELYGIASSYTYQSQANGNRMLTRTSGKGGVVTNTYDAQGRVTRQDLKKSSSYTAVTRFDYGNGNQATPGGGTTTVTSQVGATPDASLDPVTAYHYVDGQIESITTDSTQPSRAATTTFVRDPANLLPTKITDPMGQDTLFEYDALGNVTTTAAPPNNTTQTKPVTQARYDAWSQLTCAVDAVKYEAGVRCPAAGSPTPLGASGFVYDTGGNLTTSVDALGNTTTYTHGDTNHPGDVTSVEDAEGRVTGFSYDAYGNVAGTTATPSAGVTLTSQARYNAGSQLTCTVSPRLYADGVRCPAATATSFPTGANGFLYDAKGRVSTKVNAKGATTTYGYDADNNVVSVNDPKGTTTDVYDLFGRITKHTVATTATATAITSMAYDIPATASGTCDTTSVPNAVQCSTSTDPAGKVTTHYITSRGEYAGIKIPGNSVSKTTYRRDGQADVTTLFGNRTLTYDYFPDGSLKVVTSSVAGTSPVSYTYRLDGLRNTMTDATGQTSYGYDNAGRVTSITNPASGTVGYTWDDTDLLTTLTYPSGRVVTRGYDGAGRYTSVNDGAPAGGNTTTFTLDEDGLIERVDYPNTNRLDVTLRDELGGIRTQTLKNSSGTPITGFTWGRDNQSYVTNETVTGAGAVSDTYLYDKTGRLKRAGGATSDNYTYDTGNHLTTIDGPTLTYNTNGSGRLDTRVAGGQTRTYAYTTTRLTANTITTGTGTSYTYAWDGNNQLTATTATTAAGAATTTQYSYDGDHLRRSKTTGAVTLGIAYDQSTSVPRIINDGTRDYIYGPDGRPIEHINTDHTGATYYTHDQHGDTRILTDSTGAVTATYKHTPFGQSTRTSGTATTPLRFGTGYTDPETGLIYLLQRYYDPTTGNFTRPDPMLALTGSPYQYVDNNPLNNLDPTGLECQASDAIGGALDFFGIDRDGFCDWGSAGATSVNQLGGGIVNGLSPSESWSDAYNQHVGIDENAGFYGAVEKTTFWGSMLYGGYGLVKGTSVAAIRFCPQAVSRTLAFIQNGNSVLRIGPQAAGMPFRVSIGAAVSHWNRMPAWRKVLQPLHIHMERSAGVITWLPRASRTRGGGRLELW